MDIEALRQDIDCIDNELVSLFEKRMQTAKKIAEHKKENGLPLSDRAREREVIYRLTERVTPELAPYTKALYTTLFDLSKTYQSSVLHGDAPLLSEIREALENTPRQFPARATVACQGTEGAYSQFACDRLFAYPSILYMENFEGVFRAVDSGLCRYGILPVENSTAGSVTAVYELMQKYKFHIVAGTRLCIEHCLLAREGTALSDVREVYSHPQALSQCSEFLQAQGVSVRECKNTALAARELAESGRTDAAVICSSDCAELYGLVPVARAISNTENNYTRFICISKTLEIYPDACHTSLMIRLPHKPGSLNAAISRFSALGINLTKLESRPLAGTNFEFMFYFDLSASIHSPELFELLAQLSSEVSEFYYLGTYNEL